MKPYLKLETHPLADPKNVVKGDKYRITVLTEHLLRLETTEVCDEPTKTLQLEQGK